VALSWLSVDARTGVVLADLPDLDVGKVSRSICRYDSTTGTLPVPTAPDGWLAATRPGGACMVLLDDVTPIWGGMVTQRTRGSGDTIALALATIEAYFDRRFVGDVTYAQVGQNAIVADLITRYVATGPLGGIPIRVVQVGGAGTLRDRTYADQDDKTVYSVLTDLAGVVGGPEWTVEWEHQSGPERYTPVLYVGARIGTGVTPGLAPAATFELPGPVTDAAVVEDYSGGKGANSVIASSSGVSGARPQSPAQIGADDGRPTFEARFTPSTSISDVTTLTGHAADALATLAPGTTTTSMSAVTVDAPKLGADFTLGDDVGYVLGGPGDVVYADTFTDVWVDRFFPISGSVTGSVPAFPGGTSGVARAFGWELTLGATQILTPILV
jgi:hypothetical protein